LHKIDVQTNQNGEILYGNVVGSPLSQMTAYLTDSKSAGSKRPWDLKKFLKLIDEHHSDGIPIPWEFLGNGMSSMVTKMLSSSPLAQKRKKDLPESDLKKRKKSVPAFKWENLF
jgi:hypothetical protein